MKRNKGFTLLEIIIVVIIVGVLASLALPRLFSTVEYSWSTEAFAAMGTIRSAMERCLIKKGAGDYVNCDTFAEIDIPDPGLEAGAHFAYTITDTANGYVLKAKRNAVDTGNGVDTIEMTIDTVAATIKKAGIAAFLNI